MKQLGKYLSEFSAAQLMQSDALASEYTLRAAPSATAPISIEERDALLAKCVAGEFVELYIDYVAFEQKPGRSNRRFVRFEDAMMADFAASGVGSVFLIDHSQESVRARGGTIVKSELVVTGKTQRIAQTARLTSPEHVALALRGLIDRYSIGWSGPLANCSICAAEIYACDHYPGQAYAVAGEKKKMMCERVYPAAVLTETSGCNVPAVPETVGIRIRSAPTDQQNSGAEPQNKGSKMDKLMLAALGLTDESSEADQLAALTALRAESDAAKEASKASSEAAARAVIELAKLKDVAAATRIDSIVEGAIKAGKLPADGEAVRIVRELAAANVDSIAALLESLPAATLAGAPNQFTVDALKAKAADPAKNPADADVDEAAEIVDALAAYTKISPAAYAENVVKVLNLDTIEKLRGHATMVLTQT